MRVTLVHNPAAGPGDQEGDDLIALLRAAGYDPAYTSTEAVSLTRALDEPTDVVLAAGGDGTVAAVTRLLSTSGRDLPLAILPIGTANNIARSLGVQGTVQQIVQGLCSPERRMLDVAMVRAAWGSSRFVESAGIGLFAALLRLANHEEEVGGMGRPDGLEPPVRGGRLRRVLDRARARHWQVEADGEDLSGAYLLVVALNVGYVGPALALAPAADVGDGRLDLLLVRDEDRQALGDYVERIARGDEPALGIPSRRVSRVRLEWDAAHGHVDDRLWPERAARGPANAVTGMAELEVVGPPVSVVIPQA